MKEFLVLPYTWKHSSLLQTALLTVGRGGGHVWRKAGGIRASGWTLRIPPYCSRPTSPTEYEMVFLINHPQPFPPSPDLRASSGLLFSAPWSALCWLRAAAWLSHTCFCGPETQHPSAQCPHRGWLPVAGLRAASPPHTGGAETEERQELLCYWSWECKAKF